MSPQDARLFDQSYNRLAVALRSPTSDAVTKRVYFDALADLPLAAVEAAAVTLGRTQVSDDGSKSYFPTTAQWHHAAELAQQALIRHAIAPAREEPWHTECREHDDDNPEGCEDTGWLQRICRPGARCGCLLYRNHPTETHSYTVKCPCRATNATYRKRHRLTPAGAQA